MAESWPGWLTPIAPMCEAVASLLAPHAEVAAHRLDTGTIVALWNPISGRRVGDDSLVDELPDDPGCGTVLGPYEKVLIDGRVCTCVTTVVRDPTGAPVGLVCVNLDRSPLDQIAALASSWLTAAQPRPAALFDRDWREQIALRVHQFCQDHAQRPAQLDRQARRDLIAALDADGLFAVRNAAQLAADALGVSRATVYTLLKESRS